MKILFVSDTYYPHTNGVYYFVCRIGPLLQARGHDVAVIAPSATTRYTEKKIDDMDVYGIPSIPVFYYPNFRIPLAFLLKKRLRNILEIFKPDIIHIQDHFLICRTITAIGKKLGIPIIGTNHFMPENLTALVKAAKIKRLLEKYSWSGFANVYNQLDLVTTPTETGARLIRPKINVPVIAVSSGIDTGKFSPGPFNGRIRMKYGIPFKPVLLYVGRIDPEKHIEEIIEAISLTPTSTDFCFVIVGRGLERKRLETLTKSLGLDNRVFFTGFVTDEDLPLVYRLAHCFIIASIAELLSLATLQAMASGLPVIAVKSGALPELVCENENGLLFTSGSIRDIANHIRKIFCEDILRERMGHKSIGYAAKHDIIRTADAFENIYARTINDEPVLYPFGLHIAWQKRTIEG